MLLFVFSQLYWQRQKTRMATTTLDAIENSFSNLELSRENYGWSSNRFVAGIMNNVNTKSMRFKNVNACDDSSHSNPGTRRVLQEVSLGGFPSMFLPLVHSGQWFSAFTVAIPVRDLASHTIERTAVTLTRIYGLYPIEENDSCTACEHVGARCTSPSDNCFFTTECV